jgi:signal transduction histidine kinase
MIYVLNAQTGAITYLNPSLAGLLGISSEPPPDGVSRDATLVIHPDDVGRFNDLRAAMLKASDDDVMPLEARVRDAQGNFRLLGSNNTVFRRDGKGEVLEFLGIAKDVTDARAAARKAELMRQQSERVSLLNGFLSDTSHELRTPLTVINNSSYLITRVQDADERRKHSGIISEQVKRINNIIDQMQEVIRLTTLTQLETTSVRINDRIEAAIASVPALDDKQIVLHRSLDESAPVIQGDGARLQKAVMCVLDNAARFTPPGGAITVSSRVTQENGRDVVAIEIHDSGPGIPEEDLPKIFDQFFKGNRARTPDGSGAGLGLTMARQIMNLHDGQIRAASPEGSGAQFTLIVPV